MRHFDFSIDPVAKPRMTKRDQWRIDPFHPDPNKRQRPGVTQWFLFQNRLLGLAKRAGFEVPESGLSLEFYIPMPSSWSKRKRAEMEDAPHRQTPDLDNYVKAFLDALVANDSVVWSLDRLEKRWSESGRIVATVPDPASVEPLEGVEK